MDLSAESVVSSTSAELNGLSSYQVGLVVKDRHSKYSTSSNLPLKWANSYVGPVNPKNNSSDLLKWGTVESCWAINILPVEDVFVQPQFEEIRLSSSDWCLMKTPNKNKL